MTLKNDVLYVKQSTDAFYYIDMDVFKAVISRLSETQMTVGEGWTDSYLPGTITTEKDSQLIMTTIAYDKGWNVTVDGKSVETSEALNGVIAFNLDGAGEHTVIMKYRPKAFTLGLAVSVLSLALFILIIIYEKQLKAMLKRICADSSRDPISVDDYYDFDDNDCDDCAELGDAYDMTDEDYRDALEDAVGNGESDTANDSSANDENTTSDDPEKDD